MNGIIVGTDQNQEWMLPWWWERYARHNAFPVAFFDFGMTEDARKWCKERGEVVEVLPTEGIAWFLKPKAMLRSPFQKSVWLDLDCEVRGNLAPLFSYGPFAAAKEFGADMLNSGVVVFEKGSVVVDKWAKMCEEKSGEFAGDQNALEVVLQTETAQVLPAIYNWRLQLGENSDVVILHYLGPVGKTIIQMLAMEGL